MPSDPNDLLWGGYHHQQRFGYEDLDTVHPNVDVKTTTTPKEALRMRRKSIVAEPVMTAPTAGSSSSDTASTDTQPKSKRQEAVALCGIFDNFLFSRLNQEQYHQLLQVITAGVRFSKGSVVAQQGAYGDKFYIVESGTVEERVDSVVKCRYGMGNSFGTLSLLHIHQWPASYVAATKEVVLSELSRQDYQSVLANDAESKRQKRRQFVDKVPTFKKLNPTDQNRVVDALTTVGYHDGQVVYHQGGEVADNRIFIIEEGCALGVTKTEGYSRTTEKFFEEGDYFGDGRIPDNGYTQQDMTVIAQGPLTCLTMERKTLSRLLGDSLYVQ